MRSVWVTKVGTDVWIGDSVGRVEGAVGRSTLRYFSVGVMVGTTLGDCSSPLHWLKRSHRLLGDGVQLGLVSGRGHLINSLTGK